MRLNIYCTCLGVKPVTTATENVSSAALFTPSVYWKFMAAA